MHVLLKCSLSTAQSSSYPQASFALALSGGLRGKFQFLL